MFSVDFLIQLTKTDKFRINRRINIRRWIYSYCVINLSWRLVLWFLRWVTEMKVGKFYKSAPEVKQRRRTNPNKFNRGLSALWLCQWFLPRTLVRGRRFDFGERSRHCQVEQKNTSRPDANPSAGCCRVFGHGRYALTRWINLNPLQIIMATRVICS